MAFYESYKESALSNKAGLTHRVPLSVINGNIDSRTNETSKSLYGPSKPALPFAIFSDNAKDIPMVVEDENAGVKKSWAPTQRLGLRLMGNKDFHSIGKEDFYWPPAPADFEDACKEEYSPWQPSPTVVEEPEDYMGFDFPYKEYNFAHLRNLEKKYKPSATYFSKQLEVTPSMRSILVDWLVEVGQQFEFSSESVHLAVMLADRFLSCAKVSKSKLQLVGTACLFITSKYEDIITQELKMFAWITDYTYSKQQILKMEQVIMHRVECYVGGPTALSFLRLVNSMCRTPEKVLFLAEYICELSLLDDLFLAYLPSEVGVASYCLARQVLGLKMWKDDLCNLGLSFNNLKPVINCLFVKLQSAPSSNLKSVTKKYGEPEFLRVSEILVPEVLVMDD